MVAGAGDSQHHAIEAFVVFEDTDVACPRDGTAYGGGKGSEVGATPMAQCFDRNMARPGVPLRGRVS